MEINEAQKIIEARKWDKYPFLADVKQANELLNSTPDIVYNAVIYDIISTIFYLLSAGANRFLLVTDDVNGTVQKLLGMIKPVDSKIYPLSVKFGSSEGHYHFVNYDLWLEVALARTALYTIYEEKYANEILRGIITKDDAELRIAEFKKTMVARNTKVLQ